MNTKETKETLTVKEILERQRLLEEEAGEILSGRFDECTYNKGYIRQPVYACKTCKPSEGYGPGGVCYSCSISCHSGKVRKPLNIINKYVNDDTLFQYRS